MTTTSVIDTLSYARRLKEAGFTDRQAEAQADVLRDIIDSNLVTKTDLQIAVKELEAKIEASKNDTIKWVAAMLIGQAAVIAALIKVMG